MRLLRLLPFVVLLVGCHEPQPVDPEVTVMTRNLYFGFSEAGLLAAQDFTELAIETAAAWQAVVASNFPSRAQDLADEIQESRPDLIGLQEVALFRIQSPGDLAQGGTEPATQVVYDFLELLLDELAGRGIEYEAVVIQTNMDVELPSASGEDVRLADRDVILARAGLDVLSTSYGHFATQLQVPVGGAGGPNVTILRGWTSADVAIGDRMVRFVNTHLEDFAAVQEAQAGELIEAVDPNTPTILVGDLNSAASGTGTQSYRMLLDAGFADAWTGPGGETWGHDADLSNLEPMLTQRIDYVLHTGDIETASIDVVGEEPEDRSNDRWPSDHAGVVARLRIP